MSKALERLVDESYEAKESNATDDTLQMALSEIMSNDNINLKSDLNAKQIVALSKAKLYAKRYKSKAMEDLVINIMELSVSKGRKGRGELVQLMQSYRDTQTGAESSTIEKLLGK